MLPCRSGTSHSLRRDCIDIGANAGYFTLFAASCFADARVFSFEPVPVNYAQLERHRNLNSSKTDKMFS